MNTDPLNDVDSWKKVVRPTKKPRSVGSHKSKLTKSTNQKKTNQKNRKYRSVNKKIPKTPRSLNAKTPEPEKLRSILPESEELRSMVDTLKPQ